MAPSDHHEKESNVHEHLDVNAQVCNHMLKSLAPMSIKCAVELNIHDIIKNHGKPMPLADLIHALSINKAKSHCIHRLMRLLVHSKFLIKVAIEEGNEGFWLTPFSNLFLKDSPLCLTPLLLLQLDPVMMKSFSSMSEWLADDRATAFETAHGLNLWEKLGSTDTGLNALFNKAMECNTLFDNYALLKYCGKLFDGVASLVDVGGGTGTTSKAIADAFPEMKCTVLDLPHVVAGLEGVANLNYVGGNMFEAIPTADAVMLKSTLHNWIDEDCIKLLKKCKDAIPSKEKGGKVIVIDIVLNDDDVIDTAVEENKLFLDFMMMVYQNGKERNEKEWEKLFLDAGFSSYNITPTLGLISIIEVFP